MRKHLQAAMFGLFAITLLFACKKTEEFVNPEFMCECGVVKWNGIDYPLLMAEVVRTNPENPFSRRYYLTADVRLEGEVEPHNLNIQISIDTIGPGAFYIPENNVVTLFEEVNQNDELLPYRAYECTNGLVNVTPAILGGEERADYQMILREVVNGELVGFDESVSGDFQVTIAP